MVGSFGHPLDNQRLQNLPVNVNKTITWHHLTGAQGLPNTETANTETDFLEESRFLKFGNEETLSGLEKRNLTKKKPR